MTTKVQKERIEVLIEELEKLRAKHGRKVKFDMGVWCKATKEDIPEAIKNPCGTYACLAGKAGLIPRIRRMGFKWVYSKKLGYSHFTLSSHTLKSVSSNTIVANLKCVPSEFLLLFYV